MQTKNRLSYILNKFHIDPYLRILLYRVLEGKQCTQQQLKIDHPNFPSLDYDTLLQSQNKIGWRNLTKGYVSVLWESHQTRYRKMMKLSTKEDEGVWIGKIMKCFLQYVYNRWEYRNECLHESNTSSATDYLLTCIRGLYAHSNALSPQDRN